MIDLVFAPPVRGRLARILIEAPAVLIDGHTGRSHDAFSVIVHRAEAVSVPAARHRRCRKPRSGRGRQRL